MWQGRLHYDTQMWFTRDQRSITITGLLIISRMIVFRVVALMKTSFLYICGGYMPMLRLVSMAFTADPFDVVGPFLPLSMFVLPSWAGPCMTERRSNHVPWQNHFNFLFLITDRLSSLWSRACLAAFSAFSSAMWQGHYTDIEDNSLVIMQSEYAGKEVPLCDERSHPSQENQLQDRGDCLAKCHQGILTHWGKSWHTSILQWHQRAQKSSDPRMHNIQNIKTLITKPCSWGGGVGSSWMFWSGSESSTLVSSLNVTLWRWKEKFLTIASTNTMLASSLQNNGILK